MFRRSQAVLGRGMPRVQRRRGATRRFGGKAAPCWVALLGCFLGCRTPRCGAGGWPALLSMNLGHVPQPLASSPCGLFARFASHAAAWGFGALPQRHGGYARGFAPGLPCAQTVQESLQCATAARFIALRAVRSLCRACCGIWLWGAAPNPARAFALDPFPPRRGF